MKGVLWLASYPKSGNTWLRAFLANLRSDSNEPVDINELATSQFAARELLDRAIGWKTADLSAGDFDALRFPAQEVLAQEAPEIPVKTHEAFTDERDGKPLFSLSATRGAIYVVRDPLDVAVSLAHHRGASLDETIAFMNDPQATVDSAPNGARIAQFLGDWSAHVRSWSDATGLSVCVLRYEDLLAAPKETFGRAALAAGIEAAPDRIDRAIAHSSFEQLQRQESEKGFIEAARNRIFFRGGRRGGWRGKLSARQVSAIIERHKDMMRRFDYLDANDRPRD
jgi:aryl sulfotransferase